MVRTCVEILIARRGAWMGMVGMSTDPSTPSPSALEAIAWAIRALGGYVSNPLSPTDAEVESAGGAQTVADVAEYRLLLSIRGQFTRVDAGAGPVSEKWSQLAKEMGDEVERVRKDIATRYGIVEMVKADVGAIDHNLSERDELW